MDLNYQVMKIISETLVPANPDILDGVDDLMQLSYLNEPSVLYNLNYRYNQDMIYVSLLFLFIRLIVFPLNLISYHIRSSIYYCFSKYFSFMLLDKSRASFGGCESFQGGSFIRKSLH